MSGVIYTCVTGRYDRVLMDAAAHTQRFVCFTDTPRALTAPGWELRPLVSPNSVQGGRAVNRWHKLFPHRLFPDARHSIYVDGNVRLSGDPVILVEALARAGAAMGAFSHPSGHTLAREVAECRRHRFTRADLAAVDRQIATYRRAGIDFDAQIPTNNVLVRDHAAPGLAEAMDLWWQQLQRFTGRDQVSLPFVLQDTGLPFVLLDRQGGVDPDMVAVAWHRPPLAARLKRRLRAHFGIVLD